jgi:(S)-3,5-dihydroxyphenylglycine transaminase
VLNGEAGACRRMPLGAPGTVLDITLPPEGGVSMTVGSLDRPAPEPEHAAVDGVLRKENLHASVSDPVLDTMNFLNEITSRHPEAISFAPGRPYDGFFDVQEIFSHIRRYLTYLEAGGDSPARIRDALFQYGPAGGRIREMIAESLRQDEGIDVSPESIVVTVGCQEAMFLAVRALIARPEDILLVSSPCYVGITGAASVLGVGVAAVEESAGGFRCADLEAVVLAQRAQDRNPRAFYVVPDHSNPSGTTMSLETRHELLDRAAALGILILEDSPYRLVSPGRQLPTLKSLDRRRTVVHLGSFSKTLFPGARVGFAVADQTVVADTGESSLLADELTKIKSMVTVNTSPLSQAVVAGMLLSAGGRATDLNAKTSVFYGEAMRSTLRQLAACLPPARRTELGVSWNEPSGGFFLAVNVPFVADTAALARSARDFGVIWTPMSYFHPDGGGTHSIRLSTSYLTPGDIAEGIARFARFVEAESMSIDTPRAANPSEYPWEDRSE